MDVRVELWRKLSAEELMVLNCGVGEDSWESLGLQGDPTIHSEGDQPWVFFGRNDATAETPVLWPPHAKSWLTGKDSDAGRDWGQEEKGMTEDEMAGWHHWLDGCESEWTPGVGDGRGGLVSCDSWGRKELDMTERLNWNELNWEESLNFRKQNSTIFTFKLILSGGGWGGRNINISCGTEETVCKQGHTYVTPPPPGHAYSYPPRCGKPRATAQQDLS